MTFWKITDTKMNCLITREEIEALGYSLKDLTQNRERTEEFLRLLLEKGEEALGMNMKNEIQRFAGAFLPDGSLLLSISCGDSDEDIVGFSEGIRDVFLKPPETDEDYFSYQVMFLELNNLIQFCSVFGGKNRAKSRLYENDGVYYLMMDFQNSEEGKQAAQALINAEEFGGVVEQDLISECYLREHERCLIEERAVEKLKEMDK